jgi:hypothetical protein
LMAAAHGIAVADGQCADRKFGIAHIACYVQLHNVAPTKIT